MNRFAILGFPLGHSISPQIHTRAFQFLKLSAEYTKIEIQPSFFDERIALLKKENWRGFNVTVPFKERVLNFLDDVEPIACKIGAVNTIKVDEQGRWLGFNTDYLGFLKPLESDFRKIKSGLVIGAGGAARAVIYGLLTNTMITRVVIANRTIERAALLMDDLSEFLEADLSVFELKKIGQLNETFDLIVNTSAVGMGKLKDEMPLDPIPFAHEKTIVYDLIYNPTRTKFLDRAEQGGLKTINGLPMLLEQAAVAFEIWTGMEFPTSVLDELRMDFL